jgi:hypothetical protein
MKTTCIHHSPHEPLILLRQWQLKFAGDHCAALLLSFFEYWHNIKLEVRRKNRESNDTAQMHGEGRTQDESLLQFHTLSQLKAGILGLFGHKKISDGIRILESLGVLTICHNPNPNFCFDKKYYFEFKPEVVNAWLEKHYTSSQAPPTTPENNQNSSEGHPDSSDTRAILSGPKMDKSDVPQAVKCTNDFPLSHNAVPPSTTPSIEQTKHFFDSAKVRHRTTKKTPSCVKKAAAITEITKNKNYTTATVANLPKATPPNCSSTLPVAAVAFCEKNDWHIGESLTTRQRQHVRQVVIDLQQQYDGMRSRETLEEEFILTLLDPSSFSQSEQHFLKKLNTLCKMVRMGRWSPPVKKVSEETEQRSALQQEEAQLRHDLAQARWRYQEYQKRYQTSQQSYDAHYAKIALWDVEKYQSALQAFLTQQEACTHHRD